MLEERKAEATEGERVGKRDNCEIRNMPSKVSIKLVEGRSFIFSSHTHKIMRET